MKRSCLFATAAIFGMLVTCVVQAGAPITAIAVSPGAGHIVTGSAEGLLVRDAANLSSVEPLPTNLEQIPALAFSPDGRYLAAVGGVPAESGVIEVYSWLNRQRLRSWEPAVDVLYGLDWTADSRALAAVGFDGTAWLVSPEQEGETQWHPGHSRGLTAVGLLPVDEASRKSPLAVTASIDQTLRVIDTTTGEPLRTLHNHTAPIHALAARPTTAGTPAVVASISDDRTVRFWQPTIGRMMRFARLESVPLCLTWTSDGGRLVTGCADGRVCVINPDTAAVRQEVPVSTTSLLSIAAFPDQPAVIIGTQTGEVRIVEILAK